MWFWRKFYCCVEVSGMSGGPLSVFDVYLISLALTSVTAGFRRVFPILIGFYVSQSHAFDVFILILFAFWFHFSWTRNLRPLLIIELNILFLNVNLFAFSELKDIIKKNVERCFNISKKENKIMLHLMFKWLWKACVE